MAEFYRADHYGNHVSGTGVLWGDYGKVRIFHRFFYKYGYLPVWDQRALIGNCRCISTVSVLCAGDTSVDQMV